MYPYVDVWPDNTPFFKVRKIIYNSKIVAILRPNESLSDEDRNRCMLVLGEHGKNLFSIVSFSINVDPTFFQEYGLEDDNNGYLVINDDEKLIIFTLMLS